MKIHQLETLEYGNIAGPKFKTPKVNGRRFNGSPILRLKRVMISPRKKIRQLLRASVSLEEVKGLAKSRSSSGNP